MKKRILQILDFAEDFSPGDIIAVTEGPNPNRDGEEATTLIVYIERLGPHGFCYFLADGDHKVLYSNKFVWGVKKVEVLGKHKPAFRQCSLGDVTWTETGIKEVDLQMANYELGRYGAFIRTAPDWAQEKYRDNEDRDYYAANDRLVASYIDFVSAGGDPKKFPKKKTKKKPR